MKIPGARLTKVTRPASSGELKCVSVNSTSTTLAIADAVRAMTMPSISRPIEGTARRAR